MARRSKRVLKSTPESQKKKRILKVTQKAAMTAGSLSALAFAPAAAQAATVTVSGSPVSLSMTAADLATATWDVDGADGVDFQLWKNGPAGSGSVHLGSQIVTYYNFGSSLNGRGLVAPDVTAPYASWSARPLQQSFSVGPTLATGYAWGAGSVSGYAFRNALNTWNTALPGGPTYYIGYGFNYGFNTGDNIFGFRFDDSDGDRHYGGANINFDTDNGVVSITKWAYETEPDTAVHVPAPAVIPLPGAHALGLLGLGAAGLARWRQRKKDKATADA